jgi:DNA-nicking Smr family endonuclease
VKPPRGLTADEAEAWAQVAATVAPIGPRKSAAAPAAPSPRQADPAPQARENTRKPAPAAPRQSARAVAVADGKARPDPGLDSHWDRRFRSGAIEPDFTLDLHGHTLDSAHARLMDGLAQARALGARVVLLIAGKARPVEHADRGERRGAIRAKVLDWLASSSHAPAIAAIRKAHQRHGGEGALYIVLRRAQGR